MIILRTDGKEDIIRKMYKEGATIQEISIAVNFNPSTVCKYTKKMIQKGELEPRHTKAKPLDQDRIIEMYNKGMTYADIGAEFSCSDMKISGICKGLRANGILKERGRAGTNKSNHVKPYRRNKTAEVIEDSSKGVKCTPRVARGCKYGTCNSGWLCNYVDITGKLRTVEKGKSGYNPVERCMCYERA